jgi:hypothetical protein
MVNAMTKVLSSVVRGYLLDLLPLPHLQSRTDSGALLFVCRWLGCSTVIAITDLSVRHAGPISPSEVLPFGLFVMTVALLVGNLIKEVAILMGSTMMNRLGLEFRRTRVTLSGAQMNEVYRPDGTWDRCILESAEIIHEWSDPNGKCQREVLDCSVPADFRELKSRRT